MRFLKWWWSNFIWAIGVAGVNAWKIYDALYDEQKSGKHLGLSPKWTHTKFLKELVYDFILPGQTKKHVDLLRETDDASVATSVWLTHSFLLYGQLSTSEEEIDWSCPSGMKDYFKKNKAHYITRDRMEKNFFSWRLDGQRHAWVHAMKKHHCQYCHYQWANEFDDAQREIFQYMRQN
jgi:hypothetical protein